MRSLRCRYRKKLMNCGNGREITRRKVYNIIMHKQIKIFFLILTLFFVTVLIPSFAYAQNSKFYQVTLNYDKGSFTLKDIVVYPGEISKSAQEGAYKVELLSFSNSSLY